MRPLRTTLAAPVEEDEHALAVVVLATTGASAGTSTTSVAAGQVGRARLGQPGEQRHGGEAVGHLARRDMGGLLGRRTTGIPGRHSPPAGRHRRPCPARTGPYDQRHGRRRGARRLLLRGRRPATRSTGRTTTPSTASRSRDEAALFERLVLEINQAGLSWLTILKKRDGFRAAYDGFDVDTVAGLRRRANGPGCWPTPASSATGSRSTPPSPTPPRVQALRAEPRLLRTPGSPRTTRDRRTSG